MRYLLFPPPVPVRSEISGSRPAEAILPAIVRSIQCYHSCNQC